VDLVADLVADATVDTVDTDATDVAVATVATDVAVATRWTITPREMIPTEWSSASREANNVACEQQQTVFAAASREAEWSSVYLHNFRGWGHKGCVSQCSVCSQMCPRTDGVPVNPDTDTAVADTAVADTAVADTVCAGCAAEALKLSEPHKRLPPVPLFDAPVPLFDERLGSKRPAPNWLSNASAVRKKAASDAARSLAGIPEGTEWIRDFGGVYTNKLTGSFYTLDSEGKSLGFVCGKSYDDPYFKTTRVWDTLEERVQAIQSHKMLLEMRDL
jgi:hypothetical protein